LKGEDGWGDRATHPFKVFALAAFQVALRIGTQFEWIDGARGLDADAPVIATGGFGSRTPNSSSWVATERDDGSYRMLFLRANC
jgi:hypothetical protein